jgi:hypothetical protein
MILQFVRMSPLVVCVLARTTGAMAQSLEPPPPLAPPGLPSTPIMPQAAPPPNDESQDSGLGLEWVWANADIGAAYVNLQSFDATNLALQKTETSGPTYGVAAGIRLLFLTVGVRAEDLQLASIGSLWELSLEAALHTRIGRIDPYLGVRGGYNFVGTLSIHGFDIGPTFGLDVYLVKYVSLGVDLDAQFLFLQRPKPALPAGITESMLPVQYQQLYDNSGSSVGFGVTGTAHLGLHF